MSSHLTVPAVLMRWAALAWGGLFRVRLWLPLAAMLLGPFASSSHAQMLRDQAVGDIGVGWSRAWVDIDGDGRDDFCFLTGLYEKDLKCRLNKIGGGVTVTFADLWQGRYADTGGSLRWVDTNGDGTVDVCREVALPSPRLVCRIGPAFNGPAIEVPWTITTIERLCPAGVTCGGDNNGYIYQFVPGVAIVGNVPDFHLADVNGDGIPDLCYLYQVSEVVKDLRCRIATVSTDRQNVTYQAESSVWTLPNVATGADGWPQGFFDFNADGLADYCRVLPGGQLRCTLSLAAGFLPAEVSSQGNVSVQWHEGAAFVDINGDGNVDFCRLVGSAAAPYLRCTLSNGKGWEFGGVDGNTRELLSGTLVDAGHAQARWWVDINGDGLPDFCRLASTPDPTNMGSGGDVTGHLICTLSRGDGVLSVYNPGFSFTDVRLDNINLGLPDGGRAFCDANGTGILTFCRATLALTVAPEPFCQESNAGVSCTSVYNRTTGIFAGFTDSLPSARQGVMESFSDGVGAEIRITYMPLTSPQVYSRSGTGPSADMRLQLVQPRSPVVFETRAWVLDPSNASPPALTGLARYLYKDLRSDYKRGSLGFRERWTFHAGANTLDHVVFYQGLGPTVDPGSVLYDAREVGAVKCQEKLAVVGSLVPDLVSLPNYTLNLTESNRKFASIRSAVQAAPTGGPCAAPDAAPTSANPFVLLQATTNTLADSVPANPRMRFTNSSTVKTWDWTGTARIPMPTQTTTTVMSDLGNITSIDQITFDSSSQWRKLTTNEYAQDNVTAWLLGRLTRASVKTWAPTDAVQLAARASSVGTSPGAGQMQGPVQPASAAAAMSIILQLLFDE